MATLVKLSPRSEGGKLTLLHKGQWWYVVDYMEDIFRLLAPIYPASQGEYQMYMEYVSDPDFKVELELEL